MRVYIKPTLARFLPADVWNAHAIVKNLLDNHIEIKELYTGLFQRSLYKVGELWENNRITVANEHLATAITESLLNLAYPSIFASQRKGKKALVSCCANEFHQVGGKMAADFFELHGWDGYFLGSNTSTDRLIQHVDKIKPDIVGMSLSISLNASSLKLALEAIQANFSSVDILVGGQAFFHGALEVIKSYDAVEYIASLDELEKLLQRN